jgi:oligosaccharide repeat unit polymerase
LNSSYVNLSIKTVLVVVLSIISFVLGAFLLFISKKNISIYDTITNYLSKLLSVKINGKLLLFTLFFLSVVIFTIEVILVGYLPVFEMFDRFVYEEVNDKLIPFVHYFVVLSSIIPAWAYIFYKKEKISKFQYYFLHIVSLFININFFSRQFVLLYMICMFFSYYFYYKANFRNGILMIISILLMFIFIGFLRIIQDNTKKYKVTEEELINSDYLDNLSKTKYNLTTVENYLTVYSSNRFYELNKFVNQKDSLSYYGYGMYTFKPIISLLFLNRLKIVDYETNFNIPDALPTFVVDAYLDYGIIGSIFINFFYGVLSTVFFLYYYLKKPLYIVNFSIIVFCLAMSSFFNYFNTFFVWMAIFFNTLILKND